MDTNRLYREVVDIRNEINKKESKFHFNRAEFIKDMEEKHTYLNEKCPRLLKMAVQDTFDMKKLLYMLHMLKKVQSNKMTETQASTVIGQKYADEYVKPLVDNLKKNK